MSNFHRDFYKSKSPQKYQSTKKTGGPSADFCTIHSEKKTIFCLSSECVTKLCPSCVMFHSQIHQQNGNEPVFESIENTQAINSEKADFLVGFYRENLEKLQNLRLKKQEEWSKIIYLTKQKVKKVKESIFECVENFFREVEDKLLSQYIYTSQNCSFEKINMPIEVILVPIFKNFVALYFRKIY